MKRFPLAPARLLLLRGDIIGHLMRETRNVDVYVISRD